MLELKVRDGEREVVLQFEHSLLSLSKWESKNKTAFLATPAKTSADMIDYFQDMLLSGDPNHVYRLSPGQMDDLANYINDPMTASSVPVDSGPKRPNNEVVTSELIYYWMTALKINWDAQYWHLNRLMMLINIANFKQQPEKKRSRGEQLAKWREINARNKERFGTAG